MERVFFDHAAGSPTTARTREILAALAGLGNPSSVHSEGRLAREAVDAARERLARALGVDADEVVFTGSGTEADNLALRGVVALRERPHLVTTAIEHHAVLRTARALEARGARVTWLAPDSGGLVDPRALDAALGEDTALASVMLVNNEVGSIQDVAAMGASCRRRGVPFHVDAAQATGRLDVTPAALGADLVTLSAHKAGGPAGVGVLVVRRGVKLLPPLSGGDQEGGLRPGTQNAALLVAGAEALADAMAARAATSSRLAELGARLEAGLLALPHARIHGDPRHRAPGIVNAGFRDVPGATLLRALDLEGFAVSAGSACTSGSLAPSHVLTAMGLDDERAREGVRVSLGAANTLDEIDALLAVLPRVLARARAAGPVHS